MDTRKQIVENDLNTAIEKEQFSLSFQPQFYVTERKIMGLEALLRWNHPQIGKISPTEFIPIAEQSMLIHKIGEWVLYEACRQNKHWQQNDNVYTKVSVNIGARQFQQANFPNLVKDVLKYTKLDPDYLEIEITESYLVNNVDKCIETIIELKHMGISIAIDDFGTGYSSFSYIKRLPINKLKIDQSFIQNIEADINGQFIVEAIINLAHKLGLQVIAEGVETKEEFQVLVDRKCDGLQGYYFSKPLPLNLVSEFFRQFSFS